jgi:hypothetical protein
MKRFGLGVSTLAAIEYAQVAKPQGHVAVLRPQYFLPD